jgi:hypothetical protein
MDNEQKLLILLIIIPLIIIVGNFAIYPNGHKAPVSMPSNDADMGSPAVASGTMNDTQMVTVAPPDV